MPSLPRGNLLPIQTTGLYNADHIPLKRVPFERGTLVPRGVERGEVQPSINGLMKALINDWRTHWNQPDLPFLIVQLANFMQDPAYAVRKRLGGITGGPTKACGRYRGRTGLVVTIRYRGVERYTPPRQKGGGKTALVAGTSTRVRRA